MLTIVSFFLFWDIGSFFVVAGNFHYDRKKKVPVVCLAGVSVFGSVGKLAVFLLWREIFITTGKKKVPVHYRKKKIQLSVWQVRDHLRPEKKRYSRLSDGCAVLAITTGKKKIQ